MKKIRKKISYVLVTFFVSMFILNFNNYIVAYADDTGQQEFKNELDKQENELKNDFTPLNPLNPDTVKDASNGMQKIIDDNKYKIGDKINAKGIVNSIQTFLFNLVIKTRTTAIIVYAITWVVGIVYMAIRGSRDVNARRKVFLVIRNSTVLFFVYINIPLAILWLSTNKEQLDKITLFNAFYAVISFLQHNSLIIASLLGYAGISRILISKNDLPLRKQGQYLIKFSFITLFFLNIVPIAMYFII